MIKVILYTRNETYCGFSFSGHAGFRKAGEDIVCSAASMLAINTVNAIEGLTEAAFTVESDEKGPKLCLMLTESDEKAELLLAALALGMKTMEQEYGKFIALKEEVRTC